MKEHEIVTVQMVVIRFAVGSDRTRIRLEDYLFERFPDLSRMYLRDVIKAGNCEVNGRVENKGKRVTTGDFIEIEIDLQRETAMRPEAVSLDIVFEDRDLIAINKPAGMLVHPTHWQRNGTLLNALSFHLNRGKRSEIIRPGLVHRLDCETSGLIVVAKNLKSHRILAQQFQKRVVAKSYRALVEGVVGKENGTIDSPIGRYREEKRWDVMAGAKPALTRFQVIKRLTDTTLIELEPVTGRTNQLRIHCASIGHPIVGDVSRGGRAHQHLCLHAFRLRFRHPISGQDIELETRVPYWIGASISDQ